MAGKDEPYSTIRLRSRSYQTRPGIRWPDGCVPVAIEERQTGVSDGNVETARRYSPCEARNASAGALPLETASSKTSGVRPSMMTRMAFLVLISRRRSLQGDRRRSFREDAHCDVIG